jgi:hypothetical protein
MSKEFETKAIEGELVMVDFDTKVEKRAGGTYDGTNIIFKAFGKVNEKAFTTKTFEFKPALREQLESIGSGEAFTLHQYREVGSQFWNVDSVEKGHTAKRSMPAASPQGSAPSNSGSFVNPAAVGQAINLAVSLGLVKTYQEFSPETVANAIASYKAVTDQFTKAWDSAKPESVEFDDDIPF